MLPYVFFVSSIFPRKYLLTQIFVDVLMQIFSDVLTQIFVAANTSRNKDTLQQFNPVINTCRHKYFLQRNMKAQIIESKYKKTNMWIKQSATGRFHVPVNMASCVFVRQNKFRQPKT